MTQAEFAPLLERIGLNEKESLIYLTLVQNGHTRASRLAEKTGIKPGMTYKTLDDLIARGLVETLEKPGSPALFYPAHPSKLTELLEAQESQIAAVRSSWQSLVGTLASSYNLLVGRPNVQMYEGISSISILADDMAHATTEICSITDVDRVRQLYSQIDDNQRAKRRERNIKKRILCMDTPATRSLMRSETPEFTERRFVPENINLGVVVSVYDNKVSFITLEENRQIGVLIEDAAISAIIGTLFNLVWSSASIPA